MKNTEKQVENIGKCQHTPETPRDGVFNPRRPSTATVHLRKAEIPSKISKKCGSAQREELTTYDPTVVQYGAARITDLL